MTVVVERGGVVVMRPYGELRRMELERIARDAKALREEGREVVLDLSRVSHLHYAGAAALRAMPGLKVAGASGYVWSLVMAGGAGGYVEKYRDLEEAVRAA
jgi:hypothetical protein